MTKKNADPLRVEMLRYLKERYNDKEFCKGVYVTLHSDKEVIEMIEWLKNHRDEEISKSEIMLKAMELKYNTHSGLLPKTD